MNKIGIYFAYWTSLWQGDCLYYLNKVADLGFDVLETASAQILEMSKYKQDEFKKAAEEKGIEITYCIGFPCHLDMASDQAEIRKNGIEYAKKTLETIHRMNGKIFGGINYSSWPGVIDEEITDKRPYLERSISSIREVAGTAEDYGIDYCLEVVNRYEQILINTVAEGLAFIDAVGSPNVKLHLDTYHMNIEEDFIGEAIKTAGKKIGHLHIGETNRKTPGNGHMPWDEIMDSLATTGYKGRIVMEPFVKMGGEVGKNIKVWRDLSNEADESKLDADAKAALGFIRKKIKAHERS